jgi:hypothetical protein
MSRLKTFLTYLLILVAFFLLSRVLENALIKNMYYDMTGTIDNKLEYNGQIINLDVKVTEAKSTRLNGYMNITVTNNSNIDIEEAYIKVMLYSKSNVYATQKYMDITDLKAGSSKNYTLRFSGSYIKTYKVTLESEFLDKEYIFNLFGYEINTRNIFGLDLSSYINAKSIGEFTRNIFHSISITAKSVPWWGYLWAWTIIVGVW